MAEYGSAIVALSLTSLKTCLILKKAIESIKDVTPDIGHWKMKIILLESYLQATQRRLEKAQSRGLTNEILGGKLYTELRGFFESFQGDLEELKATIPDVNSSSLVSRRWFSRATAKSLLAFKNLLNENQALRRRVSDKADLLNLSIQAISLYV